MYKKVDRIGEVDGRKLVVLWNLIEVVVWWFEKVLGGEASRTKRYSALKT